MTDPRQPSRRPLPPLFALLLIVPAPSFGAWMLFHAMPGTALGSISYAAGKVVLYGLPIVWTLWVEKERLSLSKPTKGGFTVGIVLGLVISAAIWATFLLYAESRVDPAVVRGAVAKNNLTTALNYWLACAGIATVNALLEEYAFRWFIFKQCERLMPAALAVVLAGVIFTLHHVFVLRAYFDWSITLLACAGIFVGGVVWSWMYLRYRSVWPGYVSHAIVDVAVFAIGWRLITA